MWNRKVFIRIIEVLLTLACVITLRVTDDESRRIFAYLRSRNLDWYPLRNVTWGIIGAALASATCGGYLIVTTGLLIGSASGELTGRKTELFFLGLGLILFGIVGSLSLASIEDIPESLIDNAAIFGALCLITGLVFIADLLISPPSKKNKHDGTQTHTDKETAIKPSPAAPTMSLENESRTPMAVVNVDPVPNASTGNRGVATTQTPEEPEDPRRYGNLEDEKRVSSSQPRDREDRFSQTQRPRTTESRDDLRDRIYEPDDGQSRDYVAQNFDNGRIPRESQQRYRDRDRDARDYERRPNVSRLDDGDVYHHQGRDFKQRPSDDVDTPLFPSVRENIGESRFSKIVNPSVKIMRVERDHEDAIFDTRNSDTSQYDNVPGRMVVGNLEGILKKQRDVSFNVPSSIRSFRAQAGSNKDDIEMLEEWISVLKETNEQNSRTPSSPIDPGYVRHTANNWPRDFKAKTPGSSPVREINNR